MPYYTRTYNPQPTARVTSQELKNEFQAIDNALDAAEADVGKGIRAPEATTALPNAASRALKVLSFDASGNPRTTISEVDLLTTAAADAAVAETTAAAAAAAISEANALSSANAAAMVASPFTSGQTVAVGDVRYSPVDMLTYRAKTAGAHTTDPSADATNWARISGNLVDTDLKTLGGQSLVGSGDIDLPQPTPSAPFSAGVSLVTASGGTFTVPTGVSEIRAYVFGKGGNGGNASSTYGGGGGGSCTWGTIPVSEGEVFTFMVAGTVAKLVNGAVEYLTANAGGNGPSSAPVYGPGGVVGVVGSGLGITASGSAAGGVGQGGGGASGSPIGTGGAGSSSLYGGGGGGGGWGGNGGFGGGGAGGEAQAQTTWPGNASGGAGPNRTTGAITRPTGRDSTTAYTDPLLRICTSPGLSGSSVASGNAYGESGGPGAGGAGAGVNSSGGIAYGGDGGWGGGGGAGYSSTSSTTTRGGNGGFGGGGGGSSSAPTGLGGNGGIGGGGGVGATSQGQGGSAAVLIFY